MEYQDVNTALDDDADVPDNDYDVQFLNSWREMQSDNPHLRDSYDEWPEERKQEWRASNAPGVAPKKSLMKYYSRKTQQVPNPIWDEVNFGTNSFPLGI